LETKRRAGELGFDLCGIAEAANIDPTDRLGAWLARGYQAGMGWMERTKAVRHDVREKLPGARSVVVVARNYYAGERPALRDGEGKVARYAWGRDYHDVLRGPLEALATFIKEQSPGAQCYCCVDSAPVMEKAWAVRAGIGWQGKNGLILNQELGSWFVLGAIVTTAELAADAPLEDGCGACRRCLEACPTGAIVEPGVVDAGRCISYWTVEAKEPAGVDTHGWAFGCDVCQEVCPWNGGVTDASATDFVGENRNLDISQLLEIGEEALRRRFGGSAIWRMLRGRLKRRSGGPD